MKDGEVIALVMYVLVLVEIRRMKCYVAVQVVYREGVMGRII